MQTTRVQTAFRLDTGLINRLKRKAKAKGQSLNAYVESVLVKDAPAELVWPKVTIPKEIPGFIKELQFDRPLTFTKEELEEQKAVKVKMLSAILDKLAVPPSASPVKARNFAMACKPVGVRLAWVCNFKHAMHSSPCGCAKPHLGGKWVVLGKNSSAEIKDDK